MEQAAVSGADLPRLVTDAMTVIEAEFEPLLGVLPKDYGIFETKVLEDLMRLFNSEQIKQATGDVFGRIYEYFLAKFSIQKAHDNGEFFTPSSIVQTIVNVIEPDHGTVFDPACGSGGMFVQSSHFIEHEGGDTAKKVVFYGQEKNRDTIRIAKMNLAVHGLEGRSRRRLPTIRMITTWVRRRPSMVAVAISLWPIRHSTWTWWMPSASGGTRACRSDCRA